MLPTQDQSAIAVVTRIAETDSGTDEIFRYDLGAHMATNLGAQQVDGRVTYAIGTDDGRLLVWPTG
jgi:hypothetical protein